MDSRTPILDQVAPVPRLEYGWNSAIQLTQLVLVGAGFCKVLVLNRVVFRASPLWTLAVLILADRISCLLHECGHAITSILLRRRLIVFRVGPISLMWPRHGFRLVFDWKKLFMGGAVVSGPPPGGTRRWQLLISYASGPLANLLTMLFLAMQWRAWLQLAPTYFLPLLYTSATYFFTNLIPQVTGWTLSDGARLVSLIDRDHARTVCGLLDLFGCMNRGDHPWTWDRPGGD